MKAKRFLLFILASLCLFSAFGMKSSILSKIKILKDKYAGYEALFKYNLDNLCVKAEAASFLAVKVNTETGLENFEDVAMIAMDPQDKFSVSCYVYNQRDFLEVQSGILRTHPDFIIKVYRAETKKEAVLPDDLEEGHELYMRITMPAVDDDRYDLMNNTLEMLYTKARTNIENTNATEGRQAIELCAGVKEDLNIVKPEVESLYHNTIDAINNIRDGKREEIEEGHQRWLQERQAAIDAETHPGNPIYQGTFSNNTLIIKEGAKNAFYSRKFSYMDLRAVCLPFSLEAETSGGVFYAFDRYLPEENTVVLTPQTGRIEAGKGYLFLAYDDLPGMYFAVADLIDTPAAPQSDDLGLYGIFSRSTFPQGAFVLKESDDESFIFRKGKEGTSYSNYQSYLWLGNLVDPSVDEINIRFSSSETTALDPITTDTPSAAAALYDLRGHRVASPSRGEVYIRQGKKYVYY